MELSQRTRQHCINKGIDFDALRQSWSSDEYRLQDDSDGSGVYIHTFNEAVIGCSKPTQEELDAI